MPVAAPAAGGKEVDFNAVWDDCLLFISAVHSSADIAWRRRKTGCRTILSPEGGRIPARTRSLPRRATPDEECERFWVTLDDGETDDPGKTADHVVDGVEPKRAARRAQSAKPKGEVSLWSPVHSLLGLPSY